MLAAAIASLLLLVPIVAARESASSHHRVGSTIDHPPGSLQSLIDAAPSGAEIVVPSGTYRESVVIDRPLTLRGPDAEIRGSDPWDEWRSNGSRWISAEAVPEFQTGARCVEARCDWPEQVFIDGASRLQVEARPGPGEFALDGDRHIVLGDDPTGHLVEVTVRPFWMEIDGPDVTIDGFTMRHAATPSQFGGLQARDGADRLTVRNVTLSDTHAALISFQDVSDASLLDSLVERGGQLGIQSGGDGTTNLTIRGNVVRGNNTEGFDPEWEAGGMKITQAIGLRVTDNDVEDNLGPGIWCDIDCRDIVIAENRVTGNSGNGIFFEISQGADIVGNRIAENGWAAPTWGWGAGVLISSSSGATVRDNDLAWNADGITVISQERGRDEIDRVFGTTIRDNWVFSDAAGGYLLAWLEDWDSGIYDAESGNVGMTNRFWHERPEPGPCRFEWDGCRRSIAAFAATPGGTDSVYVTQPERNQVLESDALPPVARPHPVEPLRPRDAALLLVGLSALGVVVVVGSALVIVRRRRLRRGTP